MRRGEIVAATALLLCLGVQALYFAHIKSATYDEAIHVLAGYYALIAGDFSIDFQHPPLARMWCAVPLLGLGGLRLPTEVPEAAGVPSLFWGPMFMWRANHDGVFLTWITRLPMIALTVVAGAVLYGWARGLYGRRSALLALFLYAFCPAVLGYGPLATTDFPAAATSLFAGFALWAWLRRPSVVRGAVAGLTVGIAWGSKISTLFLGPAVVLLVICRWLGEPRPGDGAEALPRSSRAVLWVTALLGALCFVPTDIVALAILGLWLGRIGHCQEAFGWRPAFRRAAHDLPMLCVGVICYVGLRQAMAWAGSVAPLGCTGLSFLEALVTLCVGVAVSWVLSRLAARSYVAKGGRLFRSVGILPRASRAGQGPCCAGQDARAPEELPDESGRDEGLWPAVLEWLDWESLSNWIMRTALVVGIAALTLWACYGFECRPRQKGDSQPWAAHKRLKGPIPKLAAVVFWRSGNRRLPLRSYFSGIEMVRRLSEKGGHGCGMIVASGAPQWAYFSITLISKTPCALLVLLLMSTAMVFKRGVGVRRDELPVLVLPLIYLAVVLRGQITDGLRHLLPLYPFAILWASRVIRDGRRSRTLGWTVASLAVWYGASVFSASPHFLAYFNQGVGGPRAGADLFCDANVDWGQDLRLLARYQERHPQFQPMGIAYFGTAAPRVYGVRGERISLGTPCPGYVAASITLINDGDEKQAWLRTRPIVARIGGSIRVYGK